jgi:maltose alpha-D-glucosyltransferase / alpha-amylase
VYLGGRTGVRTPMQWNGGWNAGFSSADPEQLYQPLVANALFGYQAVNVTAQLRNQSSLLRWMQRIIAVRKSSRAFGRGTLRVLSPANHRIFAYLRALDDEQLLIVNNLASSAQAVELDLSEFAGAIPIEMFGGSVFPRVGTGSYVLTLGPHAFYWFRLRWI